MIKMYEILILRLVDENQWLNNDVFSKHFKDEYYKKDDFYVQLSFYVTIIEMIFCFQRS